jgi:hypothetical protein
MFNFLKNKKEESMPEWAITLTETQERWFSFLEKLEVKMEELCTVAIPELKELLETDDDMYKRTFHKVQSGIKGQLENIRKKAYDTYEEKVNDVYASINSEINVLHPSHSLLSNFRTACSDRYHKVFEEKYQDWCAQIAATSEADLEIEYQKIIADYENVKNKFTCKQCGGAIQIEKIFFMSTYVACSACQTQNTFEPSTQARNLQNIARGLAEQRTAELLEIYEIEYALERELYHQQHVLKISINHEMPKKEVAEKQAEINAFEKRRQEAIRAAPIIYQQYLRAMYDALNKIIPDLKEHHEKMYEVSVQQIAS